MAQSGVTFELCCSLSVSLCVLDCRFLVSFRVLLNSTLIYSFSGCVCWCMLCELVSDATLVLLSLVSSSPPAFPLSFLLIFLGWQH